MKMGRRSLPSLSWICAVANAVVTVSLNGFSTLLNVCCRSWMIILTSILRVLSDLKSPVTCAEQKLGRMMSRECLQKVPNVGSSLPLLLLISSDGTASRRANAP